MSNKHFSIQSVFGASAKPPKARKDKRGATEPPEFRVPHWPRMRQEKRNHADTTIWSEKHAPSTSEQLSCCLHKKTLDRCRSWLQEATEARAVHTPPKRLLVISGRPGVGKSATIRVLAKELGLTLSEWNDTFGTVKTWRSDGGQDDTLPPRDAEPWDRETHTPYVSQLGQFDTFLHSGAYSSLSCLAVGRAASRVGSAKRPANQALLSERKTVLLIESLPSTSTKEGSKGSDSPLEQLRGSLRRFLDDGSASPAVLVFSDVAEKNDNALERLLGRDLVCAPGVEKLDFNDVTELRAAKRLREVLRAEGIALAEGQVEQVASRANGDLRAALNDLQFRAATPKAAAKATSKAPARRQLASASAQPGVSTKGGDFRLSGVHAIGKLLHGPKKQNGDSDQTCKGGKGPGKAGKGGGNSTWDPEAVLSSCEMGPDACAAFLQHNALDFYSEVDELAQGLGFLSDADLFVASMFSTSNTRGQGETVFPEQYAASLASRAVYTTNVHPNAERLHAFKPCTKPRVYGLLKQRGERVSYLQGCLRLSTALDTQTHPSATSDVLPYLPFLTNPNTGLPYNGANPSEPAPGRAAEETGTDLEEEIGEF
mmetsp:Transcript_53218/g.121287  ORF Transcript_53218/g.121287 Transcript_53218/m.121287 type:complete len:599 (-) Transcript_53218:146-1942(-)|eukprot:CAMPEP_0172586638 /NCGR_PEP_ID=MMETSP1068-20121228/5963_1 /TAXON_ID=35684 /ORGANISM="Pseudopedinella elastica, Strain CCMP716" /LENGTH=598 /DNA_ID=CAMNT_0013381497 /DNA_START=249 /DNA_END=2045 /DNA_ORIENTATION=-